MCTGIVRRETSCTGNVRKPTGRRSCRDCNCTLWYVVFLSPAARLMGRRVHILLNCPFACACVGLCPTTGADLGFYKGGCPIHLKGAPEVERRRSNIFPAFYIFKYEVVLNRRGHWGVNTCVRTCSLSWVELRQEISSSTINIAYPFQWPLI